MRAVSLALLSALATCTACRGITLLPTIIGRSVAMAFEDIQPVPDRLEDPVAPGAGLAVLWIGHATALIQLEDRFVLTDPVFTDTVGQISKRLVEPGLDPDHLPRVDVALVSHMHFDHLSLGSLEQIERKVETLLVPRQGLVYVPPFAFDSYELGRWESWEKDGLRVTAVPVRHNGFRYGLDAEWMTESFTGYVIEYAGHTVYFGGDTGYTESFVETRRRFPHIDVALLPIAPIHPRELMCRSHLDPAEAVAAFGDLGARFMVPVHFDTFVNSLDAVGEAPRRLAEAARAAGVEHRVVRLRIGERRIFEARRAPVPPSAPHGG